MKRALDTLIASAPDGTLIVRQANLHQTSIRSYICCDSTGEKTLRVTYCTCGWKGKERARVGTAIRDCHRHEKEHPPQVVYLGREAVGARG